MYIYIYIYIYLPRPALPHSPPTCCSDSRTGLPDVSAGGASFFFLFISLKPRVERYKRVLSLHHEPASKGFRTGRAYDAKRQHTRGTSAGILRCTSLSLVEIGFKSKAGCCRAVIFFCAASSQVHLFFFFALVTGRRRSLSLKLSDTRVFEPQIRARLGTTAHFHGQHWDSAWRQSASNMEVTLESLVDFGIYT